MWWYSLDSVLVTSLIIYILIILLGISIVCFVLI
jgi:hypothetical protein